MNSYYVPNKLIKKGIVSLIILLISFQPILAKSQIKNNTERSIEINESIDNLILKIMDFGSIPSLTASIVDSNKIVWSKSYGLKNIEENQPSETDTIYLIASISKPITATAVLQLYDKGLIKLNDNVNDYLDFELKNPYYPDDNITFEMLLTHSSSLEIEPAYLYFVNYTDYNLPRLDTWIKNYFYENETLKTDVWMDVKPGTKFKYSNIGFTILGYLVERISGQNLNDYCKENIFEPLEMKNTSFNLSELNIDDIAVPYFLAYRHLRGEDLDIYTKIPHYSLYPYPAYGLRTNVKDLSNFLIAHINEGTFNDFQLLNKTTAQMMHDSIFPFAKPNQKLSYGFGWMNYGKIPKKQGHEGAFFGYSSAMKHIKFNDKGIIFFTNRELNIDLYGRFALKLIEKILVFKSMIS